MNSRAKGAAGEREFIARHLVDRWPDACRNYYQGGASKADAANVGNVHWQIKRREKIEIWAAIKQAETEAKPGDLAVVAFRRSRSRWYCIVGADEFVALLP